MQVLFLNLTCEGMQKNILSDLEDKMFLSVLDYCFQNTLYFTATPPQAMNSVSMCVCLYELF